MKKPPALVPIDDAKLEAFCEFLFKNLSNQRNVKEWMDAFTQDWQKEAPNHGYALFDEDNNIVGGIGAIYSTQMINGQAEHFCNITSWCVQDEYRAQSMRLAMALTNQEGVTITDFSPTKTVSESLKFLKFQAIDERVTLLINLPRLSSAGSSTGVLVDRSAIRSELTDQDKNILDDHDYPWLNHLLLTDSSGYCHLIFKTAKIKGLPAANIIHVGNPAILTARYRDLIHFFLCKHGLAFTTVETRWLQTKPLLSKQLLGYVPKNFFSEHLSEEHICYLYSESMCMDLT